MGWNDFWCNAPKKKKKERRAYSDTLTVLRHTYSIESSLMQNILFFILFF